MKPLKSLYQWVLSWAESAYGTLVLFLVAFAESSFFPVPADPLLMALCLGKVKKSMYYVFMCTLGSVLGGVFGFIIGYFLWYTPGGELTGVANFFFRVIPGFTPEVFDNVGAQYDAHNFLVIFTAAFTPIPYKVFSITAGVFQINLPTFIIASILGRGGRFIIIGLLIRFFGEPIKAMASGVVTLAEKDLYFTGATLIFDHGHGISTLYMHMDKIFVEKGDVVEQGEIIGTVGSSGRSTGPHLDVRLNWFGTRLDPATVLDIK